jgi:hypothetical protein
MNKIPYMAQENFTYKPIVNWYFFVICISIVFKFFIIKEENYQTLTTVTLLLIWLPIILYSFYISYKDYPLQDYINDKYNNGNAIFSRIHLWQIIHKNYSNDPLLKKVKSNYKKYIFFVLKVFFSLPLLILAIQTPWGKVIADIIRYINTGTFEG